jgi:hypothetical protein
MARLREGQHRLPEQTLDEAQGYLDAGMPFHAHEILEDAWKSAPAAERSLWKGLAQLAVGLTHAARGNAVGAASLLRRGASGIAGYSGQNPYRVDVSGLTSWAERASLDLDALGRAGRSDALDAPRLRTGDEAGVSG